MPLTDSLISRWPPLARLALFAALCAGAAWLGRVFALQPHHVSAVWLPSGVVLAGMLLAPRRHWPVLLGVAVLAQRLGYDWAHPLTWLGILLACGTALEGLLGAFLLRRLVKGRVDFRRLRDTTGLLGLGILASTLLLSTLGMAAKVLLGGTPWEDYWPAWRVFWIGDAMGVLVATPLLLTWSSGLEGWDRPRRWELLVLLVSLGVATHLVFGSGFSVGSGAFHPLTYLAFPFVLWAALRFEARGATATTAVLSAIALWHTVHGRGPFAGVPGDLRLSFLQSFLGAIALSGLLLAAALGERRRAQEKVATLNQELRQSLEKLAQAQAELVTRERMAALGELSATVAHEVRNPLGAIANCAAALRHMPGRAPDAKDAPLLEIIDEEVRRLDLLVGGLLNFARPTKPHPRPEPLEALVEEALATTLRANGAGAHVTVRLEAAAGTPRAWVDAQLLHVALSNLFTNALQAMPEGGTLTVRLEPEERPGARRVRLSISDTGPGIPSEVQGRIFEPFFTTRAQGTGLGLPIVRRIIDGHHGEVEVRSTPGQGTTFILRLPGARPTAELHAVG